VSGAEGFVTLLVGILTCTGFGVAVVRTLMRISWQLGQLVERFTDHLKDSADDHRDYEARLRDVERGRMPRRWGGT
jgi:hypothetical protein